MAITWRVGALLALGVVAVVLLPAALTVWAWVLAVAVLTLLDRRLAPAPTTLTIDRTASDPVREGGTGSTTLRVSSTDRRVRGVLRDAWQPSAGAGGNRHTLDLAPGGSTELRTTLTPTRRGDRATDRVTVRLLGPFGLAARQATTQVPGRIRVLPRFASRRHLPSRVARLRELEGRTAVQVRGQGTEFDSLREYVRGDDVRSIDWRATARSTGTVVRTWQPERDRRVVLVLDTGRTSAGRVASGAGVPRLDGAMDAALLVGALAERAGDRVDLVAGDQLVRARFRGRPGARTTERLQDVLADLEPALAETAWRRLVGAVQGLGRHRSLVVLLTTLEPTSVEQGLLPLLPGLTARHRVVLASVRDPALDRLALDRGSASAGYLAAAAEQDLHARERTAGLLRTLGVDVLDADADHLPQALADHYLALKARGRL
ncbi:lipoprotein [Marmoricola endophyticus]|uniref:Lipoprotein n=1 Tax=Marmoricola endophyticus TaxID=2040280 RepID=A0A917BH14_9ACTN|nr:DUF58 domain-containing protein [Marmoricola endophyticus]GGF43095.1 lipoprotein [Marmoricola endophyticus]